MYAPKIVAHRMSKMADALRLTVDPIFTFKDYTIDEVHEWVERLSTAFSESEGIQKRPLHIEEETFIRNEVNRCKVDFLYWATRYAFLKDRNMSLIRFNPTPVQGIFLDRVADVEWEAITGKSGDGIILACMKARQVGISTISEIIIAHRVFFYANTTALIAADVDERTQNLYEMLVRILDNMPWWMRPRSEDVTKDYRVKNKQLYWHDQDSVIRVGSASNMQGGDSGSDKGSLGTGMSQPLDAPILTPQGWTAMGAIQLGDYVIGSNGLPTKVDGIYPQGIKKTFNVTFKDRSTVECSDDHVWEVFRNGHRKLLTTLQIKAALEEGQSLMVKAVDPVAFAATDSLPLNPYLVGVLLGDGSIAHKQIRVSSADDGLIQKLATVLPENHSIHYASKYDYIISTTGKKNLVRRALKDLKLFGTKSHTKFIPPSYLFASIDDRIELLRGLLDTDGSIAVRDKNIEYCTTSPQLAEDVTHLVQSLGGTATTQTRAPFTSYFMYKGVKTPSPTRQSYRVHIRLPKNINPFFLSRKASLYNPEWIPKRKIMEVTFCGEKESQCIHVEAADHLYVTSGFVLTHNTLPLCHLSELALWPNPSQIDDALMPSIPYSPRTFAVFESTAKGRNNWWHHVWMDAKRGLGRRRPVFIPWYMDQTYKLPAPTDWTPSEHSLAHAERVKMTSPVWCKHTVHLTKNQLYWYERTRADYASRKVLFKFLAEFAADDMEAFQNTTQSIFANEMLDDIRQKAKLAPTLVEITPNMGSLHAR